MPRRGRLAGLPLAALLGAVVTLGPAISACGGSETPSSGTSGDAIPAGGGGVLRYALPQLPDELDPLAASTPAAELVSRQVYEPLVSRLRGPYRGSAVPAGLALSLRPSTDATVWVVRLRGGVRFHDGTPFNAAAVLANVRRWSSVPEGMRLLPTLFNADAPRPDLVRILLREPTPDLPRQLSSPRLGLVSPESLRPQSGERARLSGDRAPGTGPFEIERFGASPLNLGRNAAWWGTPLGLGPALDAVEFRGVPDEAARIASLRGGESEVASELSPASLAEIRADPLLTVRPGGLGLQRSVRGIDSNATIPFSGVWLTDIEAG